MKSFPWSLSSKAHRVPCESTPVVPGRVCEQRQPPYVFFSKPELFPFFFFCFLSTSDSIILVPAVLISPFFFSFPYSSRSSWDPVAPVALLGSFPVGP